MRILVTGGPVHAHLDDVKIITNKFRGGRMAEIADMLVAKGLTVVYMTTKGMPQPKNCPTVYHTGFQNYAQTILNEAKNYDAMLLGAAVANLIPMNPIKGKFPSHNYKEGDTINIPFQIAPRVINVVKQANPSIHLFGCKLLSNVTRDELVSAAYEVVLDSKAEAVFANDDRNLDYKYAVTKERSIIPMDTKGMVDFIDEAVRDQYFQTVPVNPPSDIKKYVDQAKEILSRFPDRFPTQQRGYIFGSVAVRIPEYPGSFVTTARGKKELEQFTFVAGTDFEQGKVFAGPLKATLNAPLLTRIFVAYKDINAIVHYHWEIAPDGLDTLDLSPEMKLPVLPYAPPGTRRDCQRPVKDLGNDFRIEHHGVYKMLRYL